MLNAINAMALSNPFKQPNMAVSPVAKQPAEMKQTHMQNTAPLQQWQGSPNLKYGDTVFMKGLNNQVNTCRNLGLA